MTNFDAVIINDADNAVYVAFMSRFPGVCAQGASISEVKEKMNKSWKAFVKMMSEKDFELDHELILVRSLLTDRQNKIATLGLIVRYNFDNGTIEFLLEDGNWC